MESLSGLLKMKTKIFLYRQWSVKVGNLVHLVVCVWQSCQLRQVNLSVKGSNLFDTVVSLDRLFSSIVYQLREVIGLTQLYLDRK